MVTRVEEAVAALGWRPDPYDPVWLLSRGVQLPGIVVRCVEPDGLVDVKTLLHPREGGEVTYRLWPGHLHPRERVAPTAGAEAAFMREPWSWWPHLLSVVLWYNGGPTQPWAYGRALELGYASDTVRVGFSARRGWLTINLDRDEGGRSEEVVDVPRCDVRGAW